MPWNLLSSASMEHANKDDTLVELEIYHGKSDAIGHTYLLVEREITTVSDHATETTKHRGMYGSNALRKHVYSDTETLDGYYLRWTLLEMAGIDPGADFTPAAEDQLDRDIPRTEADTAYDRAMDRTEVHGVE